MNERDDNLAACNNSNVIYLMTCKICGVQYVGETEQVFRKRMNGHRSRFDGKGKKCLLYQHSHQEASGNNQRLDDFHVQPIEVLKNETTCAERRRKEVWWMKELKTLYPYGLNDKCGNRYFSEYHKDKLVYSVLILNLSEENNVVREREGMLITSLSLRSSAMSFVI